MNVNRNILIYAGADILAAAIGLVTSPIATRLLTQEQYGAIPLLTAVWAVVSLLQYAGMDWAYPYFRVRQEGNGRDVLTTSTMIATLGAILVWLIFTLFNLYFPWLKSYANVSSTELAVFLSTILPTSIIGWYLYILRYEHQAIAFAKVSILGRTVATIIALPVMALVIQENRLIIVLAINAICSSLTVIWALGLIKKLNYQLYSFELASKKLVKPMLEYGLVLVPAGAVYSITTVVDRLLVGHYLGPASIALLSLTSAIAGLALMLKVWFARIWDPYMVEWLNSKEPSYYIPKLRVGMLTLILAMSPLAIFTTLWIEPIIRLLYPSNYHVISTYIPMLVLSGIVSTFSLIAVATVLVANSAKWHLPIYGLALLTNTLIGVITIPKYGIIGALIGTLAGEWLILISWILVGKFFYKNLPLTWWPYLTVLCVLGYFSYYSPHQFILPGHPLEAKIILTSLFVIIWITAWMAISPIKRWHKVVLNAHEE